MFRILYKDFSHQIKTQELFKPIHFNLSLGFLHNNHNHNPNLKFFSQINVESSKNPSFTINYLVDTFGFTPQKALAFSKRFSFSSEEKPNSVISLFQSYGVTKTHISELVFRRPDILLYDSDKTLKPKFDFLKELGLSEEDLSKLVASDPSFLTGSLKNQVRPAFDYLKELIGNHDDVIVAFKRYPSLLRCNVKKVLIPNVSSLRDNGVSNSMISKMIITQPRKIAWKMERFKETVERVKEMGFDPSSPMFLCAVKTMLSISKPKWEKKLGVYQEFGWSENDVLWLFKKQPMSMMISEEKIRKGLEFFMVKLKWEPAKIALSSWILLLSLEKRIIRRCTIFEILISKGLIRLNRSGLGSALKIKDKDFLDKFVIIHQEVEPELMKAFNGEIEFTEFSNVVEVKN